MTLTAAALNTLVNAPFAMPDGSTRRALWERVRETRTDGLEFQDPPGEIAMWTIDTNLVADDEDHEAWKGDAEPLEVALILPTPVAAAVIRVATEDWIIAAGHGLELCDRADEADWPAVVVDWDGINTRSSVYEQPDLLSAIVLAAHAVADALGVGR